MSKGNIGFSEGRTPPASVYRGVGSTYRWFGDSLTYKQIGPGLNNNWEVEDAILDMPLLGESITYRGILNYTPPSAMFSGPLVVGNTYLVIDGSVGGDNFSNVGYVSDGVAFIATGTTPMQWTVATAWDITIITGSILDLENKNNIILTLNTEVIGTTVRAYISASGIFLASKTFASYPLQRLNNNTLYYILGGTHINTAIEFIIYN